MNGSIRQVPRILACGVISGLVGLIAGVVVPIILDPKTAQGPLIGFMVTGPLGVLLGTLVGAVWSAARQKRVGWIELAAVACCGAFAALLYLFLARLGAPVDALFAASGLLATAVCAAASFLLAQRGDRSRSAAIVVSAAALLLFLTALYPPVAPNPFLSGIVLVDARTHFLSLWSPALGPAAYTVSEFVFDLSRLQREWLAVIVVAVVACLVLRQLKS